MVCGWGCERVVARYNDGREWFCGEVAGVRTRRLAGRKTMQYDVQYDDGDFEEDVPSERVLSTVNQSGKWEYLVVGPDEASRSLPNDQTHPWWPNAEQFVDFVVVVTTPALLAEEVANLREGAWNKYAHLNEQRPWPLDDPSTKVQVKPEPVDGDSSNFD